MLRPRRSAISASAELLHPVAHVFPVLADLRNHWQLSDVFSVLQVNEDEDGRQSGAVVRICGPLGTRRTVRTRLTAALPVVRVAGDAHAGRTHAYVSWMLQQVTPDRTRVEVRIQLLRVSLLDRLLLAGGGAAFMRRQLVRALDQLDRVSAHEAAREAAAFPLERLLLGYDPPADLPDAGRAGRRRGGHDAAGALHQGP